MKSSGLFLLLVLLMPGSLAHATAPNEFTSGCSAPERKALLRPTDPAYSYAIDLARLLASKGIHVECLCTSKLQRWFRGEVGAAYLHTGNGVFDAVFLPKRQVFQVEMIEKHENGRYLYSFRGTPTGPPTIDSSNAMWIVQHENVLILVSDQPLAARLERALMITMRIRTRITMRIMMISTIQRSSMRNKRLSKTQGSCHAIQHDR